MTKRLQTENNPDPPVQARFQGGTVQKFKTAFLLAGVKFPVFTELEGEEEELVKKP